MVFKIETTAPRQYCVRPNAQILEPEEGQEVEVLLTPLKKLQEEGVKGVKLRSFLLVQSITCGELEVECMTTPEFWVCMC